MQNNDRIAFEDFLERLDGTVGEMINGKAKASDKTIRALREAIRHAYCAGIIQGQKKKFNRAYVYGLITGRKQRK